MADTRLPALPAIDAPALGDHVYVNDVSDTTDHASGSSKRATLSQILQSGLTVNVQTFTADGTWTKPTNALASLVLLTGQGGGGGSGRRGAAASARSGGGGGAAASVTLTVVPAGHLGETVDVEVNGGGTGGAGQTANDTNGNDGTFGADTLFGNLCARGGDPGLGGDATSGVGGLGVDGNDLPIQAMLLWVAIHADLNDVFGDPSGGNGSATGDGDGAYPAQYVLLPTGGAGGGGVNASNVASAGGSSLMDPDEEDAMPSGWAGALSAAGGTAGGGNGSAVPTTDLPYVGMGGSGGGGHAAGAGGAGSNGGTYGGGGGGGGGCVNGNASGAGGNGGSGIAVIITFCQAS